MLKQTVSDESKQVAIFDGDASCKLLSVPKSLDLSVAQEEYEIWRKANRGPYSVSFEEWLRKFKGASDSTVEEYWQ